MSAVWTKCEGEHYIQPLTLEPWRVVEAQHVLSTRDLVDTAHEHDILESMLEATKPPIDTHIDYLIFTPFRYPPLKYGSRFGRTFETGCWYGALELETALAEVAHYRFQFLNDSTADLGYIDVLLTAFQAWLNTSRGIDLTAKPFHQYRYLISAKDSYEHSQTLGTAMRAANVEAFLFYSARSMNNGNNVAAFYPHVFKKQHGQYTFHHQTWQCISNLKHVEFTRTDYNGLKRYTFSMV